MLTGSCQTRQKRKNWLGVVLILMASFSVNEAFAKKKKKKAAGAENMVSANTTGSLDCRKKNLNSTKKEFIFNSDSSEPRSSIDRTDQNYLENYHCMVCNCFNEAGNQDEAGQINVGKVVMTRSRMPRVFPLHGGGDRSLCGIIKDDRQFAWLNKKSTQQPVPNGHACFQTAHKAMEFVSGVFADHYYANYINTPRWARGMKVVVQPPRRKIKDNVHIFLLSNYPQGPAAKKKKGKH